MCERERERVCTRVCEREREREYNVRVCTWYDVSCVLVAAVQTIDTCQAMFLPVGASASLLIMFLFFDSLQMIFAIFTASKS